MEKRPACIAIGEPPYQSYRNDRTRLMSRPLLRQHGVPEKKVLSLPFHSAGPEDL